MCISQFAIHFLLRMVTLKQDDIINVMMCAKLKKKFFSLYIKNILGAHNRALLHFMAITKVQKPSLNCHYYDFLCIIWIRNINCIQNLRQISSPESLEGCVIPVCNERDSNSTSFRAYQVIILKALA